MTCDFKQCGGLTSVDSVKSVKPPVKLRSSKLCSASSLTVVEYKSEKQRLRSDCMRVCAGWSEPLLVADYTLLEFSCHGSIMSSCSVFHNLIC